MEISGNIIFYLGIIILLGIGAQWLAWVLKLPSILFLLVFGFLSGPVMGLFDPDIIFGKLLLPFVSISVALILFEGGLTLQISELREVGRTILSLVIIGMIITWAVATLAARYIIGLNLQISVILGAILVVTGPTVIGPLLREIRLFGRVADILKWEGIVIDPIGAMLAVLVFEAVLIGEVFHAGRMVVFSLGKTILFGCAFGIVFARLLIILLRKFWVPDYLQETMTLALVVTAYMLSEYFQHESGLFATTVMGVVMANQQSVNVKHILEFKGNLRILIISVLFIILSARISIDVYNYLSYKSLLFLAVLIFAGRPASVFLATLGSKLNLKEKLFLSCMAPRGIVAAAVSSVFALRLGGTELPQKEFLIPLTFIVIVGTVIVYGLTATRLSRWLKLSESSPQGVLLVGAHAWALDIARIIKEAGFRTAVIDTNWGYITRARLAGIDAVYGSVLSEQIMNEIDLNGIGKLLALTPNDEVNTLATLHYNEVLDKRELYQLVARRPRSDDRRKYTSRYLQGRYLFGERYDFQYLSRKYYSGATIKSVLLTEKFDFAAFSEHYGGRVIPMFVIAEDKKLKVVTTEGFEEPSPGQYLIAMLQEGEQDESG